MDCDGQVKAVLVGCGGIANSWLKPLTLFSDCKIVGLVDIKKDNAARKRDEFNLKDAGVFETLGEALAVTRPDVVFNLTIPAAHMVVTVEALSNGCHVLGEKPMANSIEEARRMIKAAKKAGKICAIVQNRRYMDGIIRFSDMLQSGVIGELTTLNADFYIGAHCGGFQNEMEHPLLLDMAIHSFDQARFISGKDPVSVYCVEWNPNGSWYKHGASAMAIFEMTDGLIFNYRGSWCAEGVNTSWECSWRAAGSGGSAIWDGGTDMKAERPARREGVISPLTEISIPLAGPIENSRHAGVIREFLDCVRNGGEPQTVCHENIKSLAMVHSAIKSAATSRKVTIKF